MPTLHICIGLATYLIHLIDKELKQLDLQNKKNIIDATEKNKTHVAIKDSYNDFKISKKHSHEADEDVNLLEDIIYELQKVTTFFSRTI